MKNEFGRLKRKMFRKMIVSTLLTIFGGGLGLMILVDGIWQDPFARLCVWFFQSVMGLDYEYATRVYYAVFQDNKTAWVFTGLFILLLISFYITMTRFMRYFKETSDGIDKLILENPDKIELSPEMEFMERKLNTVKDTLLKRTRDAQEAEQRKNDLVVYLAHDIKTPLTSVIGYLSLLDESPDMPAEQKARYVGITLEKANRLEQLINEFFEITRYNLQSIVLNKEEINLTYMLMQIADEFYPVLEAKGKRAVVTADAGLTVYGDPDKLARVFNNILKNAAAYGYDNTDIEISAGMVQKNVAVVFSNHGKTIPPQKLDSIFEKFYRMDYSRSSGTGGAGLGLAIAKEIVNAHGGTIYAQSEKERTKFTVLLPSGNTNQKENRPQL